MAGVWIGWVEVPPSIEAKIRTRRGVTGDQVRAACQWPAVLAEFGVTEAEFDAMLANGEPVEVAGPPSDVFRRLHIELVGGGLRTYWWRLVAESGEILATSTTSYRSVEAVRRAVLALVPAMQSAPVVRVEDNGVTAGQLGHS